MDRLTDVLLVFLVLTTFKLLASNWLPDRFWASPAVADGALYLRGVAHLYCVRSATK